MNGTELALDQPSNESYPLLESVSLIHSIIWYDVFEDGARTREVEELRNAARMKYHELAVNRSVETWRIVTSMIPFFPNTASTYV